jgi:hypothetical protein
MQTGITDDRSGYRTWQKHQSGVTRERVIVKGVVRVDQETIRFLCIAGYVIVGLLALWTALTFAVCVVYIREFLPSTLLKDLDLTGPYPRDYLMKPGILAYIVLLAFFWLCWVGWDYAGEADDMPHHLLRLTAYLVASWVVFIGVLLANVSILRVVIWWRWTKAFVAQHEKHLTEAHLLPDIFRVPYQGDEYTATIFSASAMALHHGYRYFVFLPKGDATQQSTGLLIRGLHRPEGFAFDAHRLYQSLKAKRP